MRRNVLVACLQSVGAADPSHCSRREEELMRAKTLATTLSNGASAVGPNDSIFEIALRSYEDVRVFETIVVLLQ